MADSAAATGNAKRPGSPGRRLRVVLIRHGQPDIPISPRTGHEGFGRYIDDYEEAGLDPGSLPPAELTDLLGELKAVFTSDRKRAHESARALAPGAELIADALFVEAPLAAPRLPLLRMRVPKWAVVARILWHAGYHPEIEPPAKARARAKKAAEILIARAEKDGMAVLVAHGYFNFLIGRALLARGFRQSGSHRARFWNAVSYEKD
jgi:broad specificity phosphatase PhoE